MNIKEAFDHLSKGQFLRRIVEFEIDGDLVTWMAFFLMDQKVQLVIDRLGNKEREVETGIHRGFSVSPILFLIYIS